MAKAKTVFKPEFSKIGTPPPGGVTIVKNRGNQRRAPRVFRVGDVIDRPGALIKLVGWSGVGDLVNVLGVDEDKQEEFLGHFFGVSPRTVKRRREGEELSKGESLQLGMLQVVTTLAVEMLGDEETAREWLHTPLVAFENHTALEMLSSIEGYERVKSELIGQAYGMY